MVVDLIDSITNSVALGIDAVALPGKCGGAAKIEHRRTEERQNPAPQRGLAAEVPLWVGECDRQATFGLERFEIRLLRSVGLRTTARYLGGETNFRWNGRRTVGQLRHELRQRLRLKVEESGDATDERCCRLEPERRTREVRALTLRNGGEVDLTVFEWQLRGCSKDRGGRFLENRVLLVLHRHLACAREERVGPIERHTAEVVIDGVVGATGEGNAIDEQTLGVGPDLHRAEHQRTAVAASLRLRAHPDVINGFGSLRRADVLGRGRINRVVGRIPADGKTVRRKRLCRRED